MTWALAFREFKFISEKLVMATPLPRRLDRWAEPSSISRREFLGMNPMAVYICSCSRCQPKRQEALENTGWPRRKDLHGHGGY